MILKQVKIFYIGKGIKNEVRKKIEFAPYCYLVPSMLIFAVFLFYPFFKTIYLSLFMTNKMGQAKLFVGLQNYIDLLSSKSFQNSLKVTVVFVLIVVVGGMLLSFILYMFDFIDYTEEMLETDIENELVKNVTSLLMELGTGFAFMGQQYHLEVGGKDFYIDLLFYNTKLRCYVAIDLKTGEFKPEQAGKMNFYLSALDDLVKAPEDNPSVGLILCRDENRTIAEYALRDMSKPIGVSEYHLCTDLPLDLKNALPAVEDIRSRIDMKK